MVLIKLMTTLIVQFEFWDFVKDLVISPFSSVQVEQAIIMLIIPFFVNILLFWVTDNFLMHHSRSGGKTIVSHISNGKTSAGNGFHGRTKVQYLNHRDGNDSESDALITDGDDSDVDILKRDPGSSSGLDDYITPRRKNRGRFNINVWRHTFTATNTSPYEIPVVFGFGETQLNVLNSMRRREKLIIENKEIKMYFVFYSLYLQNSYTKCQMCLETLYLYWLPEVEIFF